jgi:hypothetical protein
MAGDGTATIQATFATRAAAGLAVEHLVQQHGNSRRTSSSSQLAIRTLHVPGPPLVMPPKTEVPTAIQRLKEKWRMPRISQQVKLLPFNVVRGRRGNQSIGQLTISGVATRPAPLCYT